MGREISPANSQVSLHPCQPNSCPVAIFCRLPLTAASSAVLTPAGAQGLTGPAYEVSPWSGPLSGFSLVDTAGKTWRPADLKGRAVLLNFWASWCQPCRAEMPTLQQVADLRPRQTAGARDQLQGDAGARLQFFKATGVTLPVLLDADGRRRADGVSQCFPPL